MIKILEKDINKIIGLNIKNERKKNNLTQQDLGDYLGVSFQQIQKYEKGINKINVEKFYKLAFLFRINSLDYFFIKRS